MHTIKYFETSNIRDAPTSDSTSTITNMLVTELIKDFATDAK